MNSGTMQNTSNFVGGGNQGFQIGQNSGGVYNFNIGQPTTDDPTAFIQSLSNPYAQQKNINPLPVPGTCVWFVDNANYRNWTEASHSRLLHAFAGPGCGKSVLARYLVDKILPSDSNVSAVLYFFFKRGQGDQSRVTVAISAMLHQLFTQQRGANIQSHAMPEYKNHGLKLLGMFETLWEILLATIKDMPGTVVCVFDALDECDEADCQLLMKALSDFYVTATPQTGKGTIKFLITSRPYQEVDFDFWALGGSSNLVKLDGDDHFEAIQYEINEVIKIKVPLAIPKVSIQVQNAIIEHLQTFRNTTYLWLTLIIDFMKQHVTSHGTEIKLKDLIKQLPQSIDDAYESMLQRSKDETLARKLLSVTLAARRPLTLTETKIAVEIIGRKHTNSSNLDILPDDIFKESVRNSCGLFLSIHESKIYFIHETARDYVTKRGSQLSPGSFSWKRSILSLDAEAMLSEACTKYLLLRDFEVSLPSEDPTFNLIGYRTRIYHEFRTRFGFLEYSIDYWGSHLKRCQGIILSRFKEILLRLLWDISQGTRRWLTNLVSGYRIGRIFRNVSPLDIAAIHGLDQVMKMLLNEPASMYDEWELGKALSIAARENHQDTMQLLLKHGAEVDWRPSFQGWTALQEASFKGHLGASELLLDQGADVNLDDGAVLRLAVRLSHTQMVRFLLANSANPNLYKVDDPSPLAFASILGDIDIVRLLLQAGAEYEFPCCGWEITHPSHTKEPHLITPLVIATMFPKVELTKFLLEREPVIDEHFKEALAMVSESERDVKRSPERYVKRSPERYVKVARIKQLLLDYKERATSGKQEQS